MPSVPMYNRPTVTPTPRRAITVPAAAEGATLAASALGTAAEAFQRERERAGRIRADAAEAEIRGIGARLGDEVSRMQRTQAFGAETMVAERWDAETAKVLGQIADPEVRRMVEARANIFRGELQARARTHALNQREIVRRESYQANIKSDIATLASTPLLESEPIFARMEIATRANAEAEGYDEAGIEREVQQIRATGRYAQVTSLIANDAADEALAYLQREDVKKEMQGVVDNDGRTMYDRARTLVERESMDIRAQAARDELVAQYTNVDDAIDAVKDKYEGQMEVRVRQYVEQAFADRENRKKRQVQENRELAIQAINAGRAIPTEQRRFFESTPEGAAVFADLLEFQTKRAKGEEPETDYALFEELLADYVDSPTQFAQTDLTQYRNRLSDRHYEELTRYKVGQRGTRERVSPLAVNRFVWSEAKRVGIIPSERTGVADLKDRKEERERYGLLEGAVKSALDAALAENPRLTAREQIAVMQDVIDNQVIVESGRFFVTTDTMPAAVVRPGERVVGSMARVAPADLSTPLTPAGLNRARELQRQGKTAEEIARTLRQEGLLSPTP